jgi:magnesium transporter
MGLMRQANKLANLLPDWPWNYSGRTSHKTFNPAREGEQQRPDVAPVYTVFDYDAGHLEERTLPHVEACFPFLNSGHTTWLNVDGLRKEDVERLCRRYNVHDLAIEDILSTGQRAKMDEIGDILLCLLPMLYYNENTGEIETEQVSIVLGRDFLLSFQEDPMRDVFDPVRDKLRKGYAKLRSNPAEYLCYSLIDVIVDSYYTIIEKLNQRIERLEDALLLQKERGALPKISILRREIILMQRAISPVRELVQAFLRSDSELLETKNEKYYKDVLDHITQAIDYVENHREMLMNLQDLNMSQLNMRMNEVMKTFTMVATLLAPATVIGGIFGMNFEVIPLTHQQQGFYIAVFLMLFIPLLMLIWFKRKGWF